jgi:hypothetical protein
MQTQQAEERNKPGGYGIAEADPTAAAIDTFRGPFVDHGCSDSRDMRSTRRRQPTSGFAVFAGQRQHADLGVKGSQVRILSARPGRQGALAWITPGQGLSSCALAQSRPWSVWGHLWTWVTNWVTKRFRGRASQQHAAAMTTAVTTSRGACGWRRSPRDGWGEAGRIHLGARSKTTEWPRRAGRSPRWPRRAARCVRGSGGLTASRQPPEGLSRRVKGATSRGTFGRPQGARS